MKIRSNINPRPTTVPPFTGCDPSKSCDQFYQNIFKLGTNRLTVLYYLKEKSNPKTSKI